MDLSKRLGLFALALGLFAPMTAEAQVGWLSDRSRTEGPGFQLGDFELHPGLGVEIGYDSNLYYTEDDAGFAIPRDSAILRAAAHVNIATRGAQRRAEGEAGGEGGNRGNPSATFQGGLSGTFYHFFNDNSRTNMEVDANLNLHLLPNRPFGIVLTEQFGRSVRPFTESTLSQSYARLRNDAGVRFDFQTDGGVLRISAGYNFIVDYFEDNSFQYANTLRHRITLSETFRFLPQTAIIHDTTFRVNDVMNHDVDPTNPTPLLNDGFLLRTRLGINGALTTNFSVLAMVGYAAGFYNTPLVGVPGSPDYDQDYESVAIQVGARWQILENVRLNFGYDRDFEPSYIGNFYRRDRGYIDYQMLIDGAFLLGAEVSLGYYEFGQPVDVLGDALGTSTSRGDIRFVGGLFAEYRFTEWLGVNATFRYTGNFTDYSYDIAAGPMTTLVDPASYNKIEVWGGVRVFY